MTTITAVSGYEPTVTITPSEPTTTIAEYGYGDILTLEQTATDTYIASGTPTLNYSTDTTMTVGEDFLSSLFRMLIKFDLSGIPSGALIESATLSLWQTGINVSSTKTVGAYRLLRDWVGTQATWNNYKTATAWQTAGGFGALDAEQTTVGSLAFATDSANGEKQWTIDTDSVQDWIDGDATNYGWLLKLTDESGVDVKTIIFATNENATTAQRPKLTITYRAPL